MKQIIHGKMYNTATAKFVCECDFRSDGQWCCSKGLYKTLKGAYFFAIQGNASNIWAPDNHIEVSSEKEAKVFCEEHGSPDDYISEWGEPEDA
ncbi:MAG: hypothetical protein RR415_13410 [Ruthenibacterium sp.]